MRRRLTSASIGSLLALAGVPAEASAQRVAPTRVHCAGGREFFLRLSPDEARITLDRRQLDLQRKPSSLGRQYRSALATLIIDGDLVALVIRDDLGWQDCVMDD